MEGSSRKQCQYLLRVVLGGPCQSLWKALAKMEFTEFLLQQCFTKKETSRPNRRFGGQTKVLSKMFVSTKHLKINFLQFYFLQIQATPFSFFFSVGKTDRKVKLFSRHYFALK